MLVAFLVLYHATGRETFDLEALVHQQVDPQLQLWLFAAFALAFAIKVPLFPLHTWLPDAHVEAPTAGSVLLAGVLLKMGAYGFLRLAIPLFPVAAERFAPWIAILAVIGIVYGALVALVQPNMKKLVAYSSVSHLGFVMLGIAAFSTFSVTGAVYQMLNHGVSTGALFLLVGMLYDRRHTHEIAEFGGLKTPMPRFAAVFLLIGLASIAMPGFGGFIGEFLILVGSWPYSRALTAVAVTGVILAAAYILWLIRRVFHGEVTQPKNVVLRDLSAREMTVVVPLVILALTMGVLSPLFTRSIERSAAVLVHQVNAARAAAQPGMPR
jgi:NADH-quinone oxidoreductase subunit M